MLSPAVQAWVGRYNQGGLAALQERPHTGRPPRLAAADVPRFRDRLEAGPTPADGVCTFRCQDLRRILGKRPTIPFVQCAAGSGPAFPGVGLDLPFRGGEMRASECSVLLS